jgi:hypothetical protein
MAPITNARLANSSKLLMGVVLALAVVFGSGEKTALAQTQSIDLNTGYSQSATALIPYLQKDDDWQVIADPVNTSGRVPRSAIVVDTLTGSFFNWFQTLPNSRWISPDANKYKGVLQPPRKSFHYKFCFNLPALFYAPKLTMQLRADDIIRRVTLFQPEPPGPTAGRGGNTLWEDTDPNAAASPTKPGSHPGPLLSITDSQFTDFRPGENCLQVVVEDAQVITGLNVAGSVTYQVADVRVLSMPACSSPRGRFTQSFLVDLSTGITGNILFPIDIAPLQSDPKWFVLSAPGNTSPSAAYSPASVWSIANTTQSANWIQRKRSAKAESDAPGDYIYRVAFALDTSLHSSIQLTLRYAADNSAVVRFNGGTFGGCPGRNCYSRWQGPMTLSTARFLNGVNVLDVVVMNNTPDQGNSPTGLIVEASLLVTCK